VGENARGVRNVLGSGFSEKDKENDFQKLWKAFKNHISRFLAPKIVK
jgi:hypothetical protein